MPPDAMMARPARSVVGAALATAVVTAILVALGVWQIERLSWKENLLAAIGSRIHAAPAELPAETAWPALRADDYEYRHVVATGTFEPQAEALVFRGAGGTGQEGLGPGYLVLTPLRLASGARVIVNRGFVPLAARDPAARAAADRDAGTVTVTGLMRSPEERNWFTPADTPAERQWYTRDPAAIAANFGLQRVAPFTIDEDTYSAPPDFPQGGATVLAVPNNHLGYAITWFGLALTAVAVFVAWAVSRPGGKVVR